jgi:CheY-like chemotaxis protein
MMKKLNCVLLIDDDEDDNFFHRRVIKEAGLTDHIAVTENAFQALDFIKSQHALPELIFLDINMPRMNGWEFLEKLIRLLKAGQTTTIIMLTTSMNPADEERSKTISHISDFKTKPLTGEMLSEIINTHFLNKAPGVRKSGH